MGKIKQVMTQRKPPTYKQGETWKEWRELVIVWQGVCGIPKTEQASHVILEIKCPKARSIALKFAPKRRASQTGVQDLLTFMESALGEEDPLGEEFEVLNKMDTLVRSEGESVKEYLFRFQSLKRDLEKKNIILP